MTRDEAVTRIQDGLGFTGQLTSKIQLRLQEAQRDLEKGKTLPKFLLQEDQTLSLLSGTHSVALPTGFLRVDDENPPHFFPDATTNDPTFIALKRNYREALEANSSAEAGSPAVAVIRNTVIDFITNADQNYTLTWNYYKADQVLASNIENLWLANAADWLVGFAGFRMARDARDKDGMTIFQAMMTEGRAAVFAEIIAKEESSGPVVMGANL